jgi:hypothetical protein
LLQSIIHFDPRAIIPHLLDFTAFLFAVICLPGTAGSTYISQLVSTRPGQLLHNLPLYDTYDTTRKLELLPTLLDNTRDIFEQNQSFCYRCVNQLVATILRSMPGDDAYSTFIRTALAMLQAHLAFVTTSTVPTLKHLVAYM